jgi:Protein of unknown function (DUF3108)
MIKIRTLAVFVLALTVASVSNATTVSSQCSTPGNTEELVYSWRLRGGIRLLAGLMFPTSGVGNLTTTYATPGSAAVHSELLITAPNGKKGGFYAYESDMDRAGDRTLMTYHGYAWGKKSRSERTLFDYVKRLARINKKTPDVDENRVKQLPSTQDVRDVLTAIHFLRQNAGQIKGPVRTSIYSDGKEYPVIFRPTGERRSFVIDGRNANAFALEIVGADGGKKKWDGGVKVWISEDARRIPFRIEIQESIASMQLDLQSIEACAYPRA